MAKAWLLLDRGAVLFLGIAVGVVLTLCFGADGKLPWLRPAPPPPVVVAAVAPPPVPAQAAHIEWTFPRSRNVAARLAGGQTLRIGVFGDSFGEGIGWAVMQEFIRNNRVEVYRFGHQGTGFTRYRSLDLLDETRRKVATQPIDIALVSYGANDTQGLWVDGKGAAYMTPAWQAIVGKRASDLVRFLQARGIAVGWIGLPRMRDADYDRDVQAMNRFYAALMGQLNVPFVDPVAASEGSDHRFAMELVDPRTRAAYVARAQDGIHMTLHGYQVIVRPLTGRIADLARCSAPCAAKADPMRVALR